MTSFVSALCNKTQKWVDTLFFNGQAAGTYIPPTLTLPPPPPPPPPPPVAPIQPTQPMFFSGIMPTGTFPNLSGATGSFRLPSGFFGLGGVRNPTIPPPAPFVLDRPEVNLFNQRIPQAMLSQYTVGGKNVMLKQSDYKASGGEGIVYVKGPYAYKIYHDPKKMIAEGKIKELGAVRNMPTVLGPQDVIYAGNVPVGFTMKYMADTEFLCKLFTKGFRDKNNISQDTINELVVNMQDSLYGIHSGGLLVVDYNEMNFLVNNSFDTVFHIDVDSWQTPSYSATAIMESIRDRKVQNRKFTKESDWFSFACVAMQLYTGAHPYKGRHPDFAPKDWQQMMDKGISVFNPKCKLPPACQPLNVIPKGHLKWFESVLEKGERTAPPDPDKMQVSTGPVKPAIILSSTDKFNIDLVRKYDSKIQAIRYIDGICYVITQSQIMGDQKEFVSFAPQAGYVAQRTIRDIVAVQGDKPVVTEFNKVEGKLRYKTFEGKEVGVIESKGCFVSNRAVYTVVGDSLIEVSFRNGGLKTTAMQQSVANIFHNHQVLDGFIVQNMLGTCRFAVPFAAGKCQTVHVKELDTSRIVDGKYDSHIAIVIAEQGGKYNRHTFVFSEDCSQYTSRVEKDIDLEDVNFIVKDNKVCIASFNDTLEIFADNNKVKIIPDSPLGNNDKLISFKNNVMVVNNDSLYQVIAK